MNRIKKCLVVFLVLLLLTGCSKSIGDKLKDVGFSYSKELGGYIISKQGTTYAFKGDSVNQFEFFGFDSNYSVVIEVKDGKITVLESKTSCMIAEGKFIGGCTNGSVTFIEETLKYLSIIIDIIEK